MEAPDQHIIILATKRQDRSFIREDYKPLWILKRTTFKASNHDPVKDLSFRRFLLLETTTMPMGRRSSNVLVLSGSKMTAVILGVFVVTLCFSTKNYFTHSYNNNAFPKHYTSSQTSQARPKSYLQTSRIRSRSEYCFISSTCLHSSNQQPLPGEESESNSTDNDNEQTLYDILGSKNTATRSELKRQYVKLAKVSHPDAQIGGTGDDSVDFQKIAEAWRILGNPKSRKRYDRELKAKEWGEKAQRFTNEGLEQVAPVASKIMDNVAVPFLRTTSKTFAFGKKIASGFGTPNSSRESLSSPSNSTVSTSSTPTASSTLDLNGGVDVDEKKELETTKVAMNDVSDTSTGSKIKPNATKKGQESKEMSIPEQEKNIEKVSTFMPTSDIKSDVNSSIADIETNSQSDESPIELNKLSEELMQQANAEEEKAKQIFNELDSVKEKRLFGTVQSSELSLTSLEATEVLEKLNSEEASSYVNRGMKKNAIEKDIQALRSTEIRFTEKLETYTEIDREWNIWLTRQEEAKKALTEKKINEIEARKALDNAQKMVVEAKDKMLSVSNTLRGVEEEVRKSAQEMDRVSTTLSKKQEKVQSALRRKMNLMKGGIQVEYITEQEVMLLRKKESQLMGESKQIATMVARLQSRADKLKQRADALEQWRNS